GTGDKEKTQTIDIDPDISKARSSTSKLRNLDREVNSALTKLMRDKRKAYVTVGHGEMNDPEPMPAELKGKGPERSTTSFQKATAHRNYEIKNLGLMEVAKDVPDDATVLFILSPTVPLQTGEWESLVRFLDRGGPLLLALDPKGQIGMGPLEGKLALKMLPGDLTDEVQFLPQRGKLPDRRLVLTNQFSAHASTTTLSRRGRPR